MKILKNALSLTSKYGISLHKFGPFLSLVDQKIGICLDIKDDKYGFLTRNYNFETIKEFEMFIKKYSYYKNVIKGNTKISLNDYKTESPIIKYGFDEKDLVEQQNIQIEVEAIKKAGKNLYVYLENMYNSRIEQVRIRKDMNIQMINNLFEYKKNLHKFYQKEYNEKIANDEDNSLYDYKNKVKMNLKAFNKKIEQLNEINDLTIIKQEIRYMIEIVKSFELDKQYFELIYDLYLFKNKSYLLAQMNDHILLALNAENKVTAQQLKMDLEVIKEKFNFSNTKKFFAESKLATTEEKYIGLFDLKEYNFADYLNQTDFTQLTYTEFVEKKPRDKSIAFIECFNEFTESEKRNLLILFSPLKKIINHIITINSSDPNDYSDFRNFYSELVEYFNIPENIIFKKKYFNLINFNSFETFIYSLIDFSTKLNDISFKIKRDCLVWSYSNEKKLIYASLDILKSLECIVNCLSLRGGVSVFYSKQKISLINEKFVIEDNNDVLIQKDENIFNEIDGFDELINYKPNLKKINISNNIISIVDSMEKIGIYKYKNYNVEAKVNG